MPDNSGGGLRYSGKPLQRALTEHEAPTRAFEMTPPPHQPARREPTFLDILGIYGGLLGPDAITTEAGFRRPDVFEEQNAILKRSPGTAGRAVYFGLSAAGLALLDRALARKDPRISKLLRAIVAGGQEQMLRDNINLLAAPARSKE